MHFCNCNIAGKAYPWILSLRTSLENLVISYISLAFCMSEDGLLFHGSHSLFSFYFFPTSPMCFGGFASLLNLGWLVKIKNVRYPVRGYEPVHTGLIRVVRFSSVPRMPRMPFTARAPYPGS